MIPEFRLKQGDGLWYHLLKRGMESGSCLVLLCFRREADGFFFGLVEDSC